MWVLRLHTSHNLFTSPVSLLHHVSLDFILFLKSFFEFKHLWFAKIQFEVNNALADIVFLSVLLPCHCLFELRCRRRSSVYFRDEAIPISVAFWRAERNTEKDGRFKLPDVRTDDADRPLQEVPPPCRASAAERLVTQERPCLTRDAFETGDNTPSNSSRSFCKCCSPSTIT